MADLEEVVVTGRRRDDRGRLAFHIQVREVETGITRDVSSLERESIARDGEIILRDETGLLPKIVFRTPIPAKQLQQLLDALSLFVNGYEGQLSRTQQRLLNQMNDAFRNMVDNNLTLVFVPHRFPRDSDAMMGALLNQASDGRYSIRVENGNEIHIRVDPRNIRAAHLAREREFILLHELLHLSPFHQVYFEQQYGRQQSVSERRQFNEFHNEFFFEEARSLDRLVKGQAQSTEPEKSTVEGGSGNDVLRSTNSVGNWIYGFDGDDDIRAEGEGNLLMGGAGDDRYHLGTNTGTSAIAEISGRDILEVDPPYTIANIKVQRIHGHMIIGLDTGAEPNMAAGELPNSTRFADSDTGFGIEAIIVGGREYAVEYLASMSSSHPFFTEDLEAVVRAPFRGGVVGPVPVRDIDARPVTLTIQSVTGHASDRRWWIADGYLRTDATWFGDAADTAVTIRADNGVHWTEEAFTVLWKPDPSQHEL